MSYIPYGQKSPFAVARGVADYRYNDAIEPASRENDLLGTGAAGVDLATTPSAGQVVKMFTLFQPSWIRTYVDDSLASYVTYTGADQSEALHCRTADAGDFYGGLDDTAVSPASGIDFTAYSVFVGGWPAACKFYAPRSSALVWFA
jgi:hypothetical protein